MGTMKWTLVGVTLLMGMEGTWGQGVYEVGANNQLRIHTVRQPLAYNRCNIFHDTSSTKDLQECCQNFPRGSWVCPKVAPPGHVCAGLSPPICCKCGSMTTVVPPPPPQVAGVSRRKQNQEDNSADEDDEDEEEEEEEEEEDEEEDEEEEEEEEE